jgi:hypothetical protein
MVALAEQNRVLLKALKGLLSNLPPLWGDKVIEGELELTVEASAVDEALEALDLVTRRRPGAAH